jgi:hypothetical protein
MKQLLRRMTRAAMLDVHTFEEVEADRAALGQATLVVLLACVSIGAARAWHGSQAGFATDRLIFQVVLSVIEPLALWVGGSAFAFMLGASFFRGPHTQTDFREVLRTTGFAFSPALLWSLVVVPPTLVGFSLYLAARAWTYVAVIVALRQALDFDTFRAFGTFGCAALLLWLVLWGASVAPLPF